MTEKEQQAEQLTEKETTNDPKVILQQEIRSPNESQTIQK